MESILSQTVSTVEHSEAAESQGRHAQGRGDAPHSTLQGSWGTQKIAKQEGPFGGLTGGGGGREVSADQHQAPPRSPSQEACVGSAHRFSSDCRAGPPASETPQQHFARNS